MISVHRELSAQMNQGWSAEMVLPFESQIAPSPGSTWGFAAARFVPHMDERSCSSRMLTDFHEPENFGTLVFGGRPCRVTIDDLGARWLGQNNAFISVRPLYQLPVAQESESPQTTKLNVRVIGRDKRGHFFDSVKHTLAPGPQQASVPYLIKQDGFGTVTFSLTDHEGLVRWRSGPYPVEVPPVSAALAETEQKLGAALVKWAKMADGNQKQHIQGMLEEMLMAWRSLNDRYQQREQMKRAELEHLLLETQLISGRTEALVNQISSAGAT